MFKFLRFLSQMNLTRYIEKSKILTDLFFFYFFVILKLFSTYVFLPQVARISASPLCDELRVKSRFLLPYLLLLSNICPFFLNIGLVWPSIAHNMLV